MPTITFQQQIVLPHGSDLSQLGDDVILDTKTRDGKVEISATNDLGYAPKERQDQRCIYQGYGRRTAFHPPLFKSDDRQTQYGQGDF